MGLTIDAERLSEIRLNRVATMGGPKKRYAELLDVYEELDQASAIHRRLGCPVLNVSDFSVEETAMRVIKLVADRQRERRGTASVSGRSVWRAEGRSIDEKGGADFATGWPGSSGSGWRWRRST